MSTLWLFKHYKWPFDDPHEKSSLWRKSVKLWQRFCFGQWFEMPHNIAPYRGENFQCNDCSKTFWYTRQSQTCIIIFEQRVDQLFLPFSSVPKYFFEIIALPILNVPIRYLPLMTMRNVIIETINSFLKPFIKFSTLLIKQDDNHEQQNQCHHHPFFLLKIFP